jgi:hypothetical protein
MVNPSHPYRRDTSKQPTISRVKENSC